MKGFEMEIKMLKELDVTCEYCLLPHKYVDIKCRMFDVDKWWTCTDFIILKSLKQRIKILRKTYNIIKNKNEVF